MSYSEGIIMLDATKTLSFVATSFLAQLKVFGISEFVNNQEFLKSTQRREEFQGHCDQS